MQRSIDLTSNFKPGQILYIEHQDIRLYAELIQAIDDRKLCWVRPVALVTLATDPNLRHGLVGRASNGAGLEPVEIHDLRQGVDLVCPQSLFQMALDTEVLPILAELNRLKPRSALSELGELGENSFAHEQLREFIRQIWQTNPSLFNQKPFN